MTADEPLERLFTALAADEQIVGPAVERVRAEIASYALVPTHQMIASLERNLLRAVRTLREGSVPAEVDIWEAEKTTLERLAVGVPIEDTMAGFRVSISTIRQRLVDLAAELRVPDAEVVRLTRLLWELSDVFARHAASTYRRHGVARELAEQRRRDEWLVGLLHDPGDDDAALRFSAALGLDPGLRYVTLAVRADDASSLEIVQRRLLDELRGETCLLVPSGTRLIGVASRTPAPVPGVVVALGPPTLPTELHASFTVASRVLDASPGSDGVYDVENLGWRLATVDDPVLSYLLDRRYEAPLRDARGAEGPLLEAVEAYLDHDLSIPRAAVALHVHVNTLRYRLSRFEQLTGRSLSSRDTVVEMSWVLHQRRTPTL